MKRAAYTSPFIPPEWVAAHGFTPYRVALDPSPESRVPDAGVCPYAHAFADYAGRETDAAVIIATTTCDQMRRAVELVNGPNGRPLFLMDVPATWQTDAARGLYRDELMRLARFLVKRGGANPSREQLAEVVADFDESRRQLRAARDRFSARAFSEAILALGPGETPRTVRLQPEAETRGVPLALVGGPLLHAHFALLDLIEAAGGRVVLDATSTGERALPAPIDREMLRRDPIEALVDAYFGAIPDAFRRPNDRLYAWLGDAIAERGVRGIVFHSYLWCDLWHAEAQRMEQWSGVPFLGILGNDADMPDVRTRTRIEAFLEILT